MSAITSEARSSDAPADAPAVGTIYVAPNALGMSSQLRLYVMPYPMRKGQRPRDIAYKYQKAWQEIGLARIELDHLKVVCINKDFAKYRGSIEDLYVGGFIEVELPEGFLDRKPAEAELPRRRAIDGVNEP